MAQKILLVDDEEGIRKVLGISLEDIGFQVLPAGSGEEAMDLFQKTRPAIVLTDIKMPGMDGIELLQKIKEESPDTEVIMVTGHGDMDLAIQSLKFGATDFITKPINDEVLEIALQRANERISLKSQLQEYTENLERLVKEKTEKLVEAERLAAMGQTVAGLAHAIKNVTSGLTGGAFVLEKGLELNNETYIRRGWDMIKGNVARIKGFALDLLNFTKEREPDYQLCDPNEPAREVYDLLFAKAQTLGIHFEACFHKELPRVWLDPEAIHRCLLNLVTNAIDACSEAGFPEETPRVVLSTVKPEGWAVEYRVSDTGHGMDVKTREKIFTRFFSTKGSRGTGLGLMITKKLVDEHGGTITVDSERGKGTTVVLRLPEVEPSPRENTG